MVPPNLVWIIVIIATITTGLVRVWVTMVVIVAMIQQAYHAHAHVPKWYLDR
ncbi:unnamed protein product [Gemmata massiliana]|uniref:Uncharacterized protein n=1 Tax=Gemmata massiliana TaxID=1210884 RepID=A0A6P2CY92_9BACT|nr:unnamed protein product [Gemmata massiliana]